MSQAVTQLKDEGTRTQVLLAGATAGLVSRFAIAPLDVLKIRLQLQPHAPSTTSSSRSSSTTLRSTLTHLLKHEGITALWKGNMPAEALYISYGAVQFTVYKHTHSALAALPTRLTLPDTAASFIAGGVAGSVATTATYPLDLLRTRFAAQGTTRVYAGIAAAVREIHAQEGKGGFFRGWAAGVGQVVPYMGLFFAGYEALKGVLGGLELPGGSGDAAAGVVASVASKTAVFPLDTVRKRLQVQGPTRGRYVHGDMLPEYRGVLGTVRAVVVREGVRGLYRGLSVSLLKAAPASAVTMWTYERTMALLLKADEIVSHGSA
ncbi:mitochondrial thiamine pyrophosphate carrier 1 [Pseudovirgaria hyperparasitica]|uniref:Mitochondrial thiamine pyrophosphate carrier 1 n=1 Tax=Pseudovirgaria hyperparasitica TaxID=470096 RepID=A0A6A6VTT1_9PEZI|nr:mitochondrial thiamine pyrophosphate carrier 1 [Pseudovirgaria hyperparasitica]KAF2754098.1 mitochondrial thiamine pyrophosphate carrier 1 [Pseudovirgaria hyperparasitica]